MESNGSSAVSKFSRWIIAGIGLVLISLATGWATYFFGPPSTSQVSTPQSLPVEDPPELIVKEMNEQTKKRTHPTPTTKPAQVKKPSSSVSLNHLESKGLDHANADISVTFLKVMGENIAKLTIIPGGSKPVTLPIYNSGQSMEFGSGNRKYIASVLAVNFTDKNIVVKISKIN